MMVHGEIWTIKELFVYPNEYVYWSVQIVLYPFMTGLVAGAFVLSSLYHLFGIKQLKDMARFSLVFSFALLPAAALPLQFHLMHPLRGLNVMMTPHFTSAIAAFGIVFATYAAIVAAEIWFVYRKFIVESALALKKKTGKSLYEQALQLVYSVLTLGSYDVSEQALHKDEKAITVLAGIGIPVACFLHGYVGFIFGSVKAKALWSTPLMPVIFLASAIVSGIALCILVYIIATNLRKFFAADSAKKWIKVDLVAVQTASKALVYAMVVALTLELLDMVFRGYTAVKSWDILREVLFVMDFTKIFILQFGIGNLIPFILLLLPRMTIRRAVLTTSLVLFGVAMMRWNVIIGGQINSNSFAGFMHYNLPIIPHDIETFKEGLGGVLVVFTTPFILFYAMNKILPVFTLEESHE